MNSWTVLGPWEGEMPEKKEMDLIFTGWLNCILSLSKRPEVSQRTSMYCIHDRPGLTGKKIKSSGSLSLSR